MLNSKLIEQLGDLKENGEITLKGRVIHRKGKTIVKIDNMETFHSSKNESLQAPKIIENNESYRVYIQEEVLSEVHIVEEAIDTKNLKNNN